MNIPQPQILLLDKSGSPCKWIDIEKAAYYYTKDNVIWEAGTSSFTLRGGINSNTNEQSSLTINSIIAVTGQVKSNRKYPPISNRILFKRDGMKCAYCGFQYPYNFLTRDHIHPKVKGGTNTWNNIITACKHCNSHKGSTLLSVLKWELLYPPYTPSIAESLFLRNPNMSQDQYEYLLSCIGNDSRAPILYKREVIDANSKRNSA